MVCTGGIDIKLHDVRIPDFDNTVERLTKAANSMEVHVFRIRIIRHCENIPIGKYFLHDELSLFIIRFAGLSQDKYQQ
jgi:hypothetical protein